MDKKHISFGKIPQFRDVIRNVNHQAQFIGLDDDGEPIFNSNAEKILAQKHGLSNNVLSDISK